MNPAVINNTSPKKSKHRLAVIILLKASEIVGDQVTLAKINLMILKSDLSWT